MTANHDSGRQQDSHQTWTAGIEAARRAEQHELGRDLRADGGRSTQPAPESATRLLDMVADLAHDAVDEGVGANSVVWALREAAEEIEEVESR